VFHSEGKVPFEILSRMLLSSARLNKSKFEGGGRTGPVGGHLANARGGRAKM
jgi:hypothetical protein